MDEDWRNWPGKKQAAAEVLRQEVEQRRKAYLQADADCKRLVELSRSLGLAHPDGATALRKAARQFNEALEAYSRAVRRFADFVLRGEEHEQD